MYSSRRSATSWSARYTRCRPSGLKLKPVRTQPAAVSGALELHRLAGLRHIDEIKLEDVVGVLICAIGHFGAVRAHREVDDVPIEGERGVETHG